VTLKTGLSVEVTNIPSEAGAPAMVKAVMIGPESSMWKVAERGSLRLPSLSAARTVTVWSPRESGAGGV
jgi:hypothetical protein